MLRTIFASAISELKLPEIVFNLTDANVFHQQQNSQNISKEITVPLQAKQKKTAYEFIYDGRDFISGNDAVFSTLDSLYQQS